MKLKQIPEDFRVDETYDLGELRKKNDEVVNPRFHYFILTKKDYTVNKAIEMICKTFKIQIRDVHFSGTKDRVAVTTQLVSLRRLRKTWEDDVEYFNSNNEDLNLEFVGMFPARLNLGDNLGNKFTITVRDLEESDIETMKSNFDEVKEKGALNYFDSQRFGYANNNHIVGKYLIKAMFKEAFFEIILSSPPDAKKQHREYVEYVRENMEDIVENNNWDRALELVPYWLRNEERLISYVKKYRNDYLGAISLMPKKMRTMYVSSYQSYLFNEMIKHLKELGIVDDYSELPLVSFETELKDAWGEKVSELLKKDGIELEDFRLPSSPTLQPREIMRKVRVPVNDLAVVEVGDDELNDGKMKVVLSFELMKGAYATNVVRVLFE